MRSDLFRDQRVFAAKDEFTDHQKARDPARDERTAGGLCVGEQKRLLLRRVAEVAVGSDPIEVTA
ncbi:hypothetical protein [Nonomuraea sp. SBT364]|uniref:hypothetical protein n=1 Tax=Nonomuraea sp. SBT364 TaxID=1580530 RepID=UPI00066BFC21|nr:hypothetical protein [Nonomuraea sp. SBT364]